MKKPVHSSLYRQKARYETLLFNTQHMNQAKNNVPSIIKKTPVTPDSLLVGFSNLKTFHLRSMPPTPVILREAKGEVAESTALNEALKRMDDSIPQDLVHLTAFFQKCCQLVQFPFPGLVEGFRNFKVFSRNPI